MNGHILIVEDEPALYEKLRRALVKQHFNVDNYTKSFDEAIERITKKTPDVVLLDINLKGEKTGLDLGDVLDKKYKIPFIYVTDLNDDMTFAKGLHSNHEHFIVKGKPHLNIDDVVRAIHTVLHKKKEQRDGFDKEGIIGLVGYLDEVRNYGKGGVTRVPVRYEDIAYFTIKPFINENNEEEVLLPNYVWFLTKSKEYYFFKSSLKKLENSLPRYFVRINDSYIINASSDMLEGRINGSRLSIMGQEMRIKRTYAKELEKRLESMYHS
ncbi:MAG: response regulator [Flavobacteriales bacterium]|nr:response regulator [Flavobacteriales bacterium]